MDSLQNKNPEFRLSVIACGYWTNRRRETLLEVFRKMERMKTLRDFYAVSKQKSCLAIVKTFGYYL